MKISNKVKRNLFFILLIVGLLNCIGTVLAMIFEHMSIKYWMQLCAAMGFTLIGFAYFNAFKKRVKQNILFGNSNLTMD